MQLKQVGNFRSKKKLFVIYIICPVALAEWLKDKISRQNKLFNKQRAIISVYAFSFGNLSNYNNDKTKSKIYVE